jgi:hypothetical protein
MRIGPYTGKQRTLHTELSADECLRRLRDEVYSHPALIKPNKWQEFRKERQIQRKLQPPQFFVAAGGRSSEWSWQLHGTINTSIPTTVTCRYQPARSSVTAWLLVNGLVLAYAAWALLATFTRWTVPVLEASEGLVYAQGEDVLLFGVAAVVIWLLVLVLPAWLAPKGGAQEEEQLISFLKELLNASELVGELTTHVTIPDRRVPNLATSTEQWNFTTDLSIEECLRRLREGVTQDTYARITGWWPLRHAQAFVKVDGPRFLLTADPPLRNNIDTGYIIGEFVAKDGKTIVTGGYRVAGSVRMVNVVAAMVVSAGVAALIIAGMQGETVVLRTRPWTPRQAIALGLLLMPIALLFFWQAWGPRETRQIEEAQLVALLKRLLEAEET